MLPADLSPDKPYTSAAETARATVRDLDGRLQDEVSKRDTLRQEVANTPAMLVVEDGGRGVNGAGQPTRAKSRLQDAEEN